MHRWLPAGWVLAGAQAIASRQSRDANTTAQVQRQGADTHDAEIRQERMAQARPREVA